MFGAIAQIIQLIMTTGVNISDVEIVIQAVISAVSLVQQGKYSELATALEAEIPEALPTIEKVAEAMFPNLPIAQAVAAITELIGGQAPVPQQAAQIAILKAQ